MIVILHSDVCTNPMPWIAYIKSRLEISIPIKIKHKSWRNWTKQRERPYSMVTCCMISIFGELVLLNCCQNDVDLESLLIIISIMGLQKNWSLFVPPFSLIVMIIYCCFNIRLWEPVFMGISFSEPEI